MTPSGTLVGIGARAGYPQLTVPAGYDLDNTKTYNPVNISFTGTAYSDDKLLAFGYAYEQATNLRLPPSFTNPSLWRCVPGSAVMPHSCAPGEPANETPVAGDVSGDVPATLALSLGAPSTSLGAFQPGLARDYTATLAANVISTAGEAVLSVHDPSATATGHLVNGPFALPHALQASAGSPFAPVTGASGPLTLKSYAGPVSNDGVTIAFRQAIGTNDALRTGRYSKTLVFTLSTNTP